MTFITSRAQVHIPAGNVSGTFFTVSSPYYIDGDVIIPEDSVLIIQPGVQIWFTGFFHLLVYGQLLAEGTEDSVITMRPVQEDWNGIFFYWTDESGQDTSRLEHCSISGCNSQNGGAMSFNKAGKTIVSDCEIFDNTAIFGGGVKLIESDVQFINCDFHHNYAQYDGGGFHVNTGGPSFINCRFRHNESSLAGGGGLILEGSMVTFDGCTFDTNYSNGSGAGFYARNVSQLIVLDSEFHRNTCSAQVSLAAGGALGIKNGVNALIEYCIFDNNTSGSSGGAISSYSTVQVRSCLFTENTAYEGGALELSGTWFQPVTRVSNCTFYDNNADAGKDIFIEHSDMILANSILWDEEDSTSLIHMNTITSSYTILDIYYSNIRGGENAVTQSGSNLLHFIGSNISSDPLFQDAGDGDFHLIWNSPCIEAGDPSPAGYLLSSYDLDGNPRVMNDVVDMGCYEYQLPVNIPEEEASQPCQFSVFPLPCRDRLHIRTDQLSYEVMVYDLNGRSLLEERNSPRVLDLGSLPAGDYLVRLVAGGTAETYLVPLVD